MSLSKLLPKISPIKREDPFANPPAIPLSRSKRPKYDPSELVKFECKRLVDDVDENIVTASGPKYTITLAKFGGGTPEELLEFLKTCYEIFEGQEINSGKDRFSFMQQMLVGDALAVFNNKSEELGAKLMKNFDQCVKELKKHIFPFNSLAYQKRYMRNMFKMPTNWPIRQYVTRIKEINNYLPSFPPFEQNQKLAEDEMIEIIKYGMPVKWQNELLKQDNGNKEHTLIEIVRFFEKCAQIDGKNRVTYSSDCLRKIDEKIPRKRNSSDFNQSYASGELYCDFCNKKGHSMLECRHYKRAKKEYSSLSTYKPTPHKSSYFKKPTFKKDYSGKTYHKSKNTSDKKFNREEVKLLMERTERKLHEHYKARAANRAQKPEINLMDSTDDESENGNKRKLDFSSSDDSKAGTAKNHKSSDDSSQDSDDESRLSHYGFEDRDDIVFGNNKKKNNNQK